MLFWLWKEIERADLAGSVYSAKLNGSDKQTLLYAQGNLTGIEYADLPSRLA
jgi:hypothetical protein